MKENGNLKTKDLSHEHCGYVYRKQKINAKPCHKT